jgi:hypothetical protein
MPESFSLEELSDRINAWCGEHGIAPASGQAGEIVSERNIRYYRTLGLIDAPEGGGYGEKHLLQLAEAQTATAALRVSLPTQDELWRTIPLDEDFLLVSRRGTPITPTQREAVLRALRTGSADPKNQKTNNR